MPARLRLVAHVPDRELLQRYQAAQRTVERAHWQVLWMLSQGFPTEEIAVAVGYTPTWVRKLVGRYNEGGPEALRDHRRQNRGADALLSPEETEALDRALQRPPPEGDFWSGPLVARWMSERLGRRISRQRGWDYLCWLGYTPQRPRPRHTEADEEAQAAFKSGTA